MPTPAELAALPYGGGGPLGQGISAEAFRAQYQQHGFRLRWWKAYPAPAGAVGPNGEQRESNGRIYIEQSLPATVRALVYRTDRQFSDAQFGVIEVGSTAIAVMPDEVELSRLDRVAFPAMTWRRYEFLQRGAGSSDALTHRPATTIASVLLASDGSAVEPANYALSNDGKSLVFVEGAIPTGAFYMVEYRSEPRWEFQLDQQGVMQIGSDGKFLPQRGTIKLLLPGAFEV